MILAVPNALYRKETEKAMLFLFALPSGTTNNKKAKILATVSWLLRGGFSLYATKRYAAVVIATKPRNSPAT
jgi:hypothetical protein